MKECPKTSYPATCIVMEQICSLYPSKFSQYSSTGTETHVRYKRKFVLSEFAKKYVEFKMADAKFLCYITVVKYVSLFWHKGPAGITGVPRTFSPGLA